MKSSNLKLTKAAGAIVASIAAALVFFDKMNVEQLTGMISAIGVVFGFIYAKEGSDKRKGE